uniref:biotin transporter BioY n=1 Tax=Agathobacter sp. TaxID=2021311 RepID=UPI004057CACA
MNWKESNTNKARNIVFIALFAVMIAVCSWISIPTAIPFTMQTFAVFLTLNFLGGKKGTVSVCIYLLLGLIGLPVYANFTSGIGMLMGTTGGYMIGWIFSGLVMWFLV